MAIRRINNKWRVDVKPGGRLGKRVYKSFELKADAVAWERWVRAKNQENPDWIPAKKDGRRLSDLCNLWFNQHGFSLNSATDTKRRLDAICKAMGDPSAFQFRAEHFSEYRAKRMESGVSANSMNRELSYLKAVFNELVRTEQWKLGNPLKGLRPLKINESELSYLSKIHIEKLLDSLSISKNKHVLLVAKICLSTGARWGEAEGLKISQVKNGLIQFVKTKSSKARAVAINKSLEKEIYEHHLENNSEGLFSSCMSAFREAVERAGLTFPKGQMTHILRHSFASHFTMNGGNIVNLQKILGHHSLTMTMRYAHLAPNFMEEAKNLNPLSSNKSKGLK